MKNEKVLLVGRNVKRDGEVYDQALQCGGSNGYIMLPKISEEERMIRHNEVKKACAEILINRAKEGVYL